MLKRAGISLVIAMITAILGFSGILQVTASMAQIASYVFIGFSVLSLLLSLFEGEPQATIPKPLAVGDR